VGNTASGWYATVGGGVGNTAGNYSAIPGGSSLRVGDRSFGFSGQTSATETNLGTNSNIAAFVDVDLWLYSRDFTNASQLRFYEAQAHGSGAEYVAFQAPNTLTTSTTYTLPASLTAGATVEEGLLQVDDATGELSWVTPAAVVAAGGAWLVGGNTFVAPPTVRVLGITSTNGDALALYTDNAERVRITATGEVGIGTSTPGARLHVENGEIWLFNNGSNTRFVIGDNPTTGQYGWLQWDSNLDLFRIDHSSAPGDGLKLNGNFVSIGNLPVDQPLKVGLGTTEYMRVTTTGNVGIGTTTPAATLHVDGTVAFSATTTITGNNPIIPNGVVVVEIDGGSGTVTLPSGTQGQLLFIRRYNSSGNNLALPSVDQNGNDFSSSANFHAILMYIGGGWRLMSVVY
jgi:hypothetical protein